MEEKPEGSFEWRLRIVEERQGRIDFRVDNLDQAVGQLRQDLVDTERRLTERVETGMSQVTDRIGQIDQHLSDQDSLLLKISEFIATARGAGMISVKAAFLSILIPLLIAGLTFLGYHFWH